MKLQERPHIASVIGAIYLLALVSNWQQTVGKFNDGVVNCACFTSLTTRAVSNTMFWYLAEYKSVSVILPVCLPAKTKIAKLGTRRVHHDTSPTN